MRGDPNAEVLSYNLKRLVVETETLKCAWAQVRAVVSRLRVSIREGQPHMTGKRYLEWCPSPKSEKKVCRKVKEETMRRKLLLHVEEAVKRLNLVLDGWGRYFKCEYPSRQFAKMNAYARYRLYKFLNRKSQRRYRLKYAETYYGELQKLGEAVCGKSARTV